MRLSVLLVGLSLWTACAEVAPQNPAPVRADEVAWLDAGLRSVLGAWHLRWDGLVTSGDVVEALDVADAIGDEVARRLHRVWTVSGGAEPTDLSALDGLPGMTFRWDPAMGELTFELPIAEWAQVAIRTVGSEDDRFVRQVAGLCHDLGCRGRRNWVVPRGRGRCSTVGSGGFADALAAVTDDPIPRFGDRQRRLTDRILDDLLLDGEDLVPCGDARMGRSVTPDDIEQELRRIRDEVALTGGQHVRLALWMDAHVRRLAH